MGKLNYSHKEKCIKNKEKIENRKKLNINPQAIKFLFRRMKFQTKSICACKRTIYGAWGRDKGMQNYEQDRAVYMYMYVC